MSDSIVSDTIVLCMIHLAFKRLNVENALPAICRCCWSTVSWSYWLVTAPRNRCRQPVQELPFAATETPQSHLHTPRTRGVWCWRSGAGRTTGPPTGCWARLWRHRLTGPCLPRCLRQFADCSGRLRVPGPLRGCWGPAAGDRGVVGDALRLATAAGCDAAFACATCRWPPRPNDDATPRHVSLCRFAEESFWKQKENFDANKIIFRITHYCIV